MLFERFVDVVVVREDFLNALEYDELSEIELVCEMFSKTYCSKIRYAEWTSNHLISKSN